MPDDVRTSPVTLEQYGAMDMAARRKVWLSDLRGQPVGIVFGSFT